MYNPIHNSVNLGLGTLENGKDFKFDDNEGLPIVVRDNLKDGNFPIYSETGYKIVDSGISKENYNENVSNLNKARSDIEILK